MNLGLQGKLVLLKIVAQPRVRDSEYLLELIIIGQGVNQIRMRESWYIRINLRVNMSKFLKKIFLIYYRNAFPHSPDCNLTLSCKKISKNFLSDKLSPLLVP